MVQVLTPPQKPQSFLDSLLGGVGEALPETVEGYFSNKKQQQILAQQNQALEKAGFGDLIGLPEKAQTAAIAERLKGLEKRKLFEEKKKGFSDIFNQGQQERSSVYDQLGGTQQPTEDMGIDPSQFSPEQILQGTLLDAPLGRTMQSLQDVALREGREKHKEQTDKEKEYFKLNEPKLIQMADNLNKLEMEQSRYDRLEQLFSDPSKFPSSITAAIFSKDGQINDLAYSQLSPEAQEAIKLVIDSTSNIKDTYGSRVTNFDLQTYLKKLPSLLNTQEGKARVLRDLQIMNQLNQMHANGIMEVFEEAGGTDKIPYSTAERIYKKKYGNQEKRLRELFVNPEKKTFSDLPSPFQYLGEKIEDEDTGEMFISDGVEWKPFRG